MRAKTSSTCRKVLKRFCTEILFVYVEFFSPTFTQNKTRHVAGDPSHSGEEEEDGEHGPGRYEELK